MAHELGLVGWVRNLRDGGVELVAQGEESAVRRLLEWCQQGPSLARVESLDAATTSVDPTRVDFTIERTVAAPSG